MLCEICGEKIVGPTSKIYVEGAELLVCRNCEQFGNERWSRYPAKTKIQVKLPKYKPKKDLFERLEFELLEDYTKIIRKAREKRGWSQKDLASEINERLSLIKRIELGRMPPDIKLIKKLEKALEITLTTQLSQTTTELAKKKSRGALTIGDVVIIKKNS